MFRTFLAQSLVALTLFAVLAQTALRALPDPPDPQWKQFLSWLPEDTETLLVTRQSLVVGKTVGDPFAFDKSALWLPTGPLFTLQEGLVGKELTEQRISCAVEGSRRFVPPKRFSSFRYEGAHFVQFEAAAEKAVNKAFDACLAKAEKKIELAGHRIAAFTVKKIDDDPYTAFIAQPRPALIICATDRGFLETILKRASGKTGKRALPDDLPQWKQVDVKAGVWGIRHFSMQFAKDDLSSLFHPRQGKAFEFVPADPAAIGFVFWIDFDSEVATVRYLSNSKDVLDITKKCWGGSEFRTEIKAVGPGCVEVVAKITRDKAGQMFFLQLLISLGHAFVL